MVNICTAVVFFQTNWRCIPSWNHRWKTSLGIMMRKSQKKKCAFFLQHLKTDWSKVLVHCMVATAATSSVKLNSTATTTYAKSTVPKNVVSSMDARQSSTLANYFTSVHSRLVRSSLMMMTMIRKRWWKKSRFYKMHSFPPNFVDFLRFK